MDRRWAILAVAWMLAAGPVSAQTATPNPSFNLVNRGPTPIKELFFTPAGASNWGRDRLEGKPIAPGASYPARRRADGSCIFDLRVVFEDGRIENRRGINTCNVDDVVFGGARKAADDPSFKLVNRGDAPIAEAFATPAGSGDWGKNRLVGPLPKMADRLIEIPKGTCSFDLRVVFEGGRKLERRRADLCRITDLPVP